MVDSNNNSKGNGCNDLKAPPHSVDSGAIAATTLRILLTVSVGMETMHDGRGTIEVETCSNGTRRQKK